MVFLIDINTVVESGAWCVFTIMLYSWVFGGAQYFGGYFEVV